MRGVRDIKQQRWMAEVEYRREVSRVNVGVGSVNNHEGAR